MCSVTGIISRQWQPRGGFIRPRDMKKIVLADNIALASKENINGSIVGMAVDYLTRFIMGADKEDAFFISLKGACCAKDYGKKDAFKIAKELLAGINGDDDISIINACKLATFDVWYRDPTWGEISRDYKETNPDEATIYNIKTLLKRSQTFFDKFGPITKSGFDFYPEDDYKDYKSVSNLITSEKGASGGYTHIVDAGDGDFLTADVLWEFKVIKSSPTPKHTLQLLMYWIMGLHSGQDEFKTIKKLGIFNPRRNMVYLYHIRDIPITTIRYIEKHIIRYDYSQ